MSLCEFVLACMREWVCVDVGMGAGFVVGLGMGMVVRVGMVEGMGMVEGVGVV